MEGLPPYRVIFDTVLRGFLIPKQTANKSDLVFQCVPYLWANCSTLQAQKKADLSIIANRTWQ